MLSYEYGVRIVVTHIGDISVEGVGWVVGTAGLVYALGVHVEVGVVGGEAVGGGRDQTYQ